MNSLPVTQQLLIIGLVFLIIVIGAVAGGISIKSNKTNNSADESIGDLSNGKVSISFSISCPNSHPQPNPRFQIQRTKTAVVATGKSQTLYWSQPLPIRE